MNQSDRELLALYELEWALEDEPDERRPATSRAQQAVRTLLMAIVVGAASWIPTRALTEWLTSGFPLPRPR
jgi:hypothetical protein